MPLPTTPTPHAPTRRTLRAPAGVSGVSLFTAVNTTVTIRPAQAGAASPGGIAFRRIDIPGSPPIPAFFENIIPEARRTVLAPGGDPRQAPSGVQTVEHLLSALAGLGVTHALIDIDGPEVPIGDGSAAPFVAAISAAGIANLPGPGFPPIVVHKPIRVEDGWGRIDILPPTSNSASLELSYSLDYGPAGPIPPQSASITLSANAASAAEYAREVAPARTFCPLPEALSMREMGLFRHLGPAQMLVIGDDGLPIDNAFRFPNEPARHKLLDLIGDLALVGRPIHARVRSNRSGHALNHHAARAIALAAQPTT